MIVSAFAHAFHESGQHEDYLPFFGMVILRYLVTGILIPAFSYWLSSENPALSTWIGMIQGVATLTINHFWHLKYLDEGDRHHPTMILAGIQIFDNLLISLVKWSIANEKKRQLEEERELHRA